MNNVFKKSIILLVIILINYSTIQTAEFLTTTTNFDLKSFIKTHAHFNTPLLSVFRVNSTNFYFSTDKILESFKELRLDKEIINYLTDYLEHGIRYENNNSTMKVISGTGKNVLTLTQNDGSEIVVPSPGETIVIQDNTEFYKNRTIDATFLKIIDYYINNPKISISIELIKLLKAFGLDINAKQRYTPLAKAIMYDKEDLVDKLLEAGANINQPIFPGYNPSTNLRNSNMPKHNHEDLFEKVKSKNLYNFMTPIEIAIKYKKYKMLKKLIERGANINHENDLCITPLLCAIWLNDKKAMHILLEHGANATKSNKCKHSPIDMADKYFPESILDLCLHNTSLSLTPYSNRIS